MVTFSELNSNEELIDLAKDVVPDTSEIVDYDLKVVLENSKTGDVIRFMTLPMRDILEAVEDAYDNDPCTDINSTENVVGIVEQLMEKAVVLPDLL